MKVALIPPKGMENFALQSRFHLALAIPELLTRRTYFEMYKRAARLGDYVILDNGAAEGEACSDTELLEASKKLEAKEVVLPDVLRNHRETMAAVQRFLARRQPLSGFKKLMAVPQGIKIQEFRACVKLFDRYPEIEVIGIPRHALETLNMPSARIDLANWIFDEYGTRFEVHFLGTNPMWPREIKHASKYAPQVRSVDTSLPFNYAIAGLSLEHVKRMDPIYRHDDYFTVDWNLRTNARLVRDNIRTLMEWADAPGFVQETPAGEMRGVSTT